MDDQENLSIFAKIKYKVIFSVRMHSKTEWSIIRYQGHKM